MSQKPNKHKDDFFASCPKGVEDLLLKEVEQFKLNNPVKTAGGVSFQCSGARALNFLLRTRIASRVYKKLYSFDIKNEKDLYYEAKKIKWKSVFNLDQTFRIKTLLGYSPNGEKRSQFNNSLFLSMQMKDGIVDRFREDTEERPTVDTTNAEVTLLSYICPHDNPFASKEEVSVYIDLAGEPLSNRGYRKSKFQAPLRENLAAALIDMMDEQSNGNEDFLDAMCGSGTVVIEKIIKRFKIAPSYLQVGNYREGATPWSFLKLNWFTKDKYLQQDLEHVLVKIENEFDKAIVNINKQEKQIFARDIDATHLETTKTNLMAAALSEAVIVEKADITQIGAPAGFKGQVFCNPPYGERLKVSDLEDLYYQVGESFKNNFKENTCFLFTANREMLKKISLRSTKKIPVFNGDLDCRLVSYQMY